MLTPGDVQAPLHTPQADLERALATRWPLPASRDRPRADHHRATSPVDTCHIVEALHYAGPGTAQLVSGTTRNVDQPNDNKHWAAVRSIPVVARFPPRVGPLRGPYHPSEWFLYSTPRQQQVVGPDLTNGAEVSRSPRLWHPTSLASAYD